MGTFSAQRQSVVTVAGLPGKWMTKTGGEQTADVSKHYDGGATQPEAIAAPAQTANVVVGRGYKNDRDEAVLVMLRKKVGRWRTTITVQPTDVDLVAVGQPTVYSDALLVGLNETDFDSDSGELQTISLEFAVSGPTN